MRVTRRLVEQLLKRHHLPGRVVDPFEAVFGRADNPLAEIPHVDELHRILRRAWREDVAAGRDAPRPVREPVGGIVRADDQSRPHDQGAAAERALDDRLAHRLERAVVLEVLRTRIVELLDGRAFHLLLRRAVSRIRRDTGDVDIPGDTAERFDRETHRARKERRHVQNCVPLAPAERTQILGPVAADLLHVGIQLGIRLPPVEERHVVTARERGVDGRATQELRPAEDEQPHQKRWIALKIASVPKSSAEAGTRSSAACTSSRNLKSADSRSGTKP